MGVEINGDPDSIPDTLEEAEIFMGTNVKASSEIAAQIATNLTLTWNDFNESILRRCVNDLAVLGIAVVKRDNDPQYGLKTEYVDPSNFIHSLHRGSKLRGLSICWSGQAHSHPGAKEDGWRPVYRRAV